MKKIVRAVLFLAVIYIVAKYPNLVVKTLEFGFRQVWNIATALYHTITRAIQNKGGITA